MHHFITIAGNIGVGKSTLVKLLTDKHGWEPVYEAVDDNPYLADFYTDMNRWAFQSQMFFLSRRLRQHYDLQQKSGNIIQDRSIYEDAEIFARNLYNQGAMSQRDWDTYHTMYASIVSLLQPPKLVVYLQASVETLQRQIAHRGRDYEKQIDPNYLNSLNLLYENWFSQFTLSPVLVVNTDNLDYVQYDSHLDRIWEMIDSRLHGRDLLTL